MRLAELQEGLKFTREERDRESDDPKATRFIEIQPDEGGEVEIEPGVDSPSEEIARTAELKSSRMGSADQEFDDEGNEVGPESGEEAEKKVIKSQYGTRPGSPSDGMGGGDHGTGLMS